MEATWRASDGGEVFERLLSDFFSPPAPSFVLQTLMSEQAPAMNWFVGGVRGGNRCDAKGEQTAPGGRRSSEAVGAHGCSGQRVVPLTRCLDSKHTYPCKWCDLYVS